MPDEVTTATYSFARAEPDLSHSELFQRPDEIRSFLKQHYGGYNERYSREGNYTAWTSKVTGETLGRYEYTDQHQEGYVYYPKEVSMTDNINHPSHYTFGKIEVLDAIEDWQLPYHLGNCVKYIARAGRKDPDKKVEDLKKARFYLDRYINLNSLPFAEGKGVDE